VGPEWATLANGKRSPVPSNWTGTGSHGIRKTLIQMGTSAKGSYGGTLPCNDRGEPLPT